MSFTPLRKNKWVIFISIVFVVNNIARNIIYTTLKVNN